MDLHSRKLVSTPREFSRYLQDQGAIFWSDPEQIWVVTDHQVAQAILKSPEFSADRSGFFKSKMSGCPFAKVANFFGVVAKMMVNSDGHEHTQRRKLASSGMSDHILDHFQPRVEKVVSGLLESLHLGDKIDFVQKVALPLPNIILADLFSIPADEREDFYRWANHMTQFFGGASEDFMTDAENADVGAASLRNYFTRMIEDRRKNPRGDFISHLVQSQGALDDSEVVSQAAIMLVAGTITTTDQICNNLFALLKGPMWNHVVQNPALLTAAIEEATRLDPSVNFIFRVAKSAQKIGDVEVQAGQLVFVSTHAVNRNEAVFAGADEFDLNRERNPHLSYGSGIHYCIGARLGRAQMKELFAQMIQRFPNTRLNASEKAQRKHQSLGFSGFETLPLELG